VGPSHLGRPIVREWRASSRRVPRPFEPVRACPKRGWVCQSRRGRRGRDASDRLLHSETIQPSTRASSFPSAAMGPRKAPPLSSRGFRLVLVRVNVYFARLLSRPVKDGRGGHREARGRSVRRGRGTSCFTARRPLRWPGGSGQRGVVFRALGPDDHLRHLCRLLLASARGPWGPNARRLEGRQDRFRGGLVKGVRFPGRRCLPSPVASCTTLVPEHERVTKPSSIARRSRDEDRRAPTNRLRFALRAAGAHALVDVPRRARLPFTRSVLLSRLSTRSVPVARFLEPEGVQTTSANTTMHGHRPRARRSSTAAGVDRPPARVRLEPGPQA
jgi:hypothetical protein